MGSVNKAILIGNLGADPELRYTSSNQAVTELRIATTEQWTGKDGDRKEQTEWHRVVVWGKSAEHCKTYLKKGRQVYIEGRIRTRQWEDKDGQKRYTTEVVADKVTFLGSGSGERSDRGGAERPAAGHERSANPYERSSGGHESSPREDDFGSGPVGEDDIPF